MKQTTQRIIGLAAVTTLVAATASLALARGGFGPGGGPGWGGGPGMMGGRGGMWAVDPAYAEQQLAGLKTRLGITAEQEPAWSAYAAAVKERAGIRAAHRDSMVAGGVTPEQRFAFHQQGLEQLQRLNAATQGLYAVLTPEQKAGAGNLAGRRGCRRWGP